MLAVGLGGWLPGYQPWPYLLAAAPMWLLARPPTVIADGGYRGTGLVIPHYRRHKDEELPAWKEDHNALHRRVRARIEHVFARMKGWKILRDCRLRGDSVHHAMPGIARLHNLTLAG